MTENISGVLSLFILPWKARPLFGIKICYYCQVAYLTMVDISSLNFNKLTTTGVHFSVFNSFLLNFWIDPLLISPYLLQLINPVIWLTIYFYSDACSLWKKLISLLVHNKIYYKISCPLSAYIIYSQAGVVMPVKQPLEKTIRTFSISIEEKRAKTIKQILGKDVRFEILNIESADKNLLLRAQNIDFFFLGCDYPWNRIKTTFFF